MLRNFRVSFSSLSLGRRKMCQLVLGIETSCDDTCAAVVSTSGEIIAHEISSQFEVHEPYRGIVPSLAARAHETNIEMIVESVSRSSGLENDHSKLSAIAVTTGPGLQPCLGVGIRKAKELCQKWNVPLLAIHHLEAHALTVRLPGVIKGGVSFPFLLLLVSGGHTQLVQCNGVGQYTILGTTLDDAVGEAFDKTARLLNIYPSPDYHPGEQLERLAATGDEKKIPFTIPMRKRKGTCDFSYSGLKAQVRRKVEILGEDNAMDQRANIAAAFQVAATTHLVDRIKNALALSGLKTLVVAGGVARNQYIRKQISKITKGNSGVSVHFPPLKYCTDNGVMIAWAAIEKMKEKEIVGNGDFDLASPTPRWKISHSLEESIVP